MAAELQPLDVAITLQEKDVRNGLALTILRHTPGARALPLFYGAAPLVFLAGVVATVQGHRPTVPEVMFGSLLIGFLFLVPIGIGRLARRSFTALPNKDATWRFRPHQVQLQSGDAVMSKDWSTLFGSHETKSAFYLHPQQGAFWVLPKRNLSPEQIASVQEWIKAKVRSRSRVLEVMSWLSPSAMLVASLATYLLYRWWIAS